MSRIDEIREWLEQIPAMGFDPTDAVDHVRCLLAENDRLRKEIEELNKCLLDCEQFHRRIS